jgi:hypothetical protein
VVLVLLKNSVHRWKYQVREVVAKGAMGAFTSVAPCVWGVLGVTLIIGNWEMILKIARHIFERWLQTNRHLLLAEAQHSRVNLGQCHDCHGCVGVLWWMQVPCSTPVPLHVQSLVPLHINICIIYI